MEFNCFLFDKRHSEVSQYILFSADQIRELAQTFKPISKRFPWQLFKIDFTIRLDIKWIEFDHAL